MKSTLVLSLPQRWWLYFIPVMVAMIIVWLTGASLWWVVAIIFLPVLATLGMGASILYLVTLGVIRGVSEDDAQE